MPDFGDRRVMACTPGDLKRWLGELCGLEALALSRGAYQDDGSRASSGSVDNAGAILRDIAIGAVAVDAGGFALTIRWRVLEPRRIALLKIDQLEVEFAYPPGATALAREWIGRFDRHTQRGGG